MRAQEFITERKKRSKKTRGLGGYFFPGYGFYGGDAGEGGGDGGGGGESRHVKEDVDGQQVLDYIHGTHHEPLTTQLQQAVLSYPRWELRSVPLSSLHIPDQEYDDEEQEPDADPYNRVQAIDPDHAGEYSANFVDRRPIVVDAEGWIIDGNHRAWAASELLNRDSIQAWVPTKQSISEAFDQPYAIQWTKTNGDWHATADLDDGSELIVLFMAQGDNNWMVEFERDENMEITGEGDAQRVFATVLSAMQQFIAKRKPAMLNFSAEKEDDPTGSRARLYDRMIQRYVSGTGYDLTRKDVPGGATYTLTKQAPGVAEGWKDVVAGGALALGALGAGAQTMPNINAQQVELTNKYYNALVQRAKEDGRELDRRTLNFLKAKAEDAAALKLQQASPKKQQGFPAQGSERRVSRNIDNFESQGVAEGTELPGDCNLMGQNLFLKNLAHNIKQRYPNATVKLSSDRVTAHHNDQDDEALSVMGTEVMDSGYIGVGLDDAFTESFQGVLVPTIKQTTEQLLAANPGMQPALFLGTDNWNPDAWTHIAAKLGYRLVAGDEELDENFADGKGPGRPGDSQRHGIPKGATMAQLEKASHAKGRKGQLARWQLNMRRGQKK